MATSKLARIAVARVKFMSRLGAGLPSGEDHG
jgi:hypothetical protein